MVTLRKFLVQIDKLTKEFPKALDLPLIYSSDDKGNSYKDVNHIPSLFTVEDINDRKMDMKWNEDETEMDKNYNCIIIN
jgi:hypothetical protein